MDFLEWLQKQIDDRGWSQNELGKRSSISGSHVSMVMTKRRPVTFEFCKAVADALDMPPEQVLRRAGLLDPLLPEVELEDEVINLLRGLSRSARHVVLKTLRLLAAEPSFAETGASYESHRPPAFSEQQVLSIAQDLEALSPEDRKLVFSFMKRLRGEHEEDEATDLASPVDSGT